jgi:hypothetical protein
MKFVKPVVIHPLRWTTDFDMFLLDTVNYYLTHWNSVTKKSDNPFMVLYERNHLRDDFSSSPTLRSRGRKGPVARSLGFKQNGVCVTKPLQKRQTSRRSMLMFFTSVIGAGFY